MTTDRERPRSLCRDEATGDGRGPARWAICPQILVDRGGQTAYESALPTRKTIFTMGTSAERNKNLTRPRKGGGAKLRRQNDHRKRLVALGMDEAVVAKMNDRDVLTKLKYPAKVAKEVAAAKEA